ncbi:hypothetical protein AB1I63_05990 [Streptococcus pneumoniae]
MYRVIEFILQKDKVSEFVFLKDCPTRALKKDDWFLFLYFEPLGACLDSIISPLYRLSVKERLSEEKLVKAGWQVVRDFNIAILSGELLELVKGFDVYKLTKKRYACPLILSGDLFQMICEGIRTKGQVSCLVKMMFAAGYDLGQVIDVFSNLVRNRCLLPFFLEVADQYYAEGG